MRRRRERNLIGISYNGGARGRGVGPLLRDIVTGFPGQDDWVRNGEEVFVRYKYVQTPAYGVYGRKEEAKCEFRDVVAFRMRM